MGIGYRLVGDADCAAPDQILGLLGIGSKVQVGEQDLAFAHHFALAGLRFLDLDDHVRLGENLFRGFHDLGTRLSEVIVRGVDAETGPRFHHHLMSVVHGLGDTLRGHAYPEFVVFNFFWNPD